MNKLVTTPRESITHEIARTASRATKSLFTSCVTSIKSHFAISLEVREDEDIQKILRRLNKSLFDTYSHTAESASSFSSRLGPVLTQDIFYVIPLPQNTFISVKVDGKIFLTFYGRHRRKAYELFLAALRGDTPSKKKTSTPPRTKIATIYKNRDGDYDWDGFTYSATKSLSDIYTSEKNITQVTSYLDSWKKASSLFERLNITYKLGILLYGPPGTGKTTMVKAIAQYINAPIYTIPVATLSSTPINFADLLSDDYDTSIVLLEDIDYVFSADRSSHSDENEARANALLQTLDGAVSTSNIIFIATTNSIESLNPALIRDGRFDLKIHMDNITEQAQAQAMCRSLELTDKEVDNLLAKEEYPINPAALQNKCIQHIFSSLKHCDCKEEVL